MKNAILLGGVFAFLQINTHAIPLKNDLTIFQTKAAPAFTFLRVHETANTYNLQWKTTGSGIQSFVIESTYEDPTDPYSVWQTRGMVNQSPGVNMFKDKNLWPGIINYRITALSVNNTAIAVSEILTFTVQ